MDASDHHSVTPIEPVDDGVRIIDQTRLPHELEFVTLGTLEGAAHAIRSMQVRGAPLIGITAAYGLWLAMRESADDEALRSAAEALLATRPTAVNLSRVVQTLSTALRSADPGARAHLARSEADRLRAEDVALNRSIGEHGYDVLRRLRRDDGEPVRILTHCNAGALATAGLGTATAPIYRAAAEGLDLHVWVDETRPRNQGASLTAWELGRAGIPHTVVVDNAGGHLMQRDLVDVCLVGTDRTLASGDVCNKIGTYLKALAAADNGVPFYAAVPGPSVDWTTPTADEIPIEERTGDEVAEVEGWLDGRRARVRVTPEGSPTANFGFDVTPARLVTGLITERGVCPASAAGLAELYPEVSREARP